MHGESEGCGESTPEQCFPELLCATMCGISSGERPREIPTPMFQQSPLAAVQRLPLRLRGRREELDEELRPLAKDKVRHSPCANSC